MDEKIYEAAMGLLKLSMMGSRPFKMDGKIKKSAFQTKVLERIFAVAPLPSTSMQTDLALLLKIPRRSIQVWFQNARQARRRKRGSVGKENGLVDSNDFHDMSVESMVRIINDVRFSSQYFQQTE